MTINSKELNTDEIKKGLTDNQILKIEKAIAYLSVKTKNAQAVTLYHNLKMSRDIEEKKKWIVLFYSSMFQVLSFIQMAMTNQMEDKTYDLELKKLFKDI